MYHFTSTVLNKPKIMKPEKEKCDPYSVKHSTKQNRSNQRKKQKQSRDNDSLWVQAVGYIRKRLQSSYSKYIQKNETVLSKLNCVK